MEPKCGTGLYSTFIRANSAVSNLLSRLPGITVTDLKNDIVELQISDSSLDYSVIKNEIRLTLRLAEDLNLFVVGTYLGKILKDDKLTNLRIKIRRIAVENPCADLMDRPIELRQMPARL